MCRIDAPFDRHSLEEKTDLTEHFYQALDEYCAEGIFRNLLEKHFSKSWKRELGNLKDIEAALKCAQQAAGLQEKITSFVRAIRENSASGRLQIDNPVPILQEHAQKSFPDRFAFAKVVAAEVFPSSPYSFHQCFKGSMSVRFEIFVLDYAPTYYGESCHLTKLLFHDTGLNDLGTKKRDELLWDVFLHMVEWDYSFKEHLQNAFAWYVYSSVPTLKTIRFNLSFEYLAAWVEADAQSRDHSESLELLEGKILSYIWNRSSTISRLEESPFENPWSEEVLQSFKDWARKWLDDKHREISHAWCCSIQPEGMAPEILNNWARRAYEIFLPLCPDLGQKQVEALIDWGIESELKDWIKPKRIFNSILGQISYSDQWYASIFREAWFSKLISKTEALPLEEMLRVLSRRLGHDVKIFKDRLPPFISLPPQTLKTDERLASTDEFHEFIIEKEHHVLWDSLLRDRQESVSFPMKLYPHWTLEVLSRDGFNETLVPRADKSIGIVRGNLKEDNNALTAEDMHRLLKILEKYTPEKALRHRLMLLRTTEQPCTNENLDVDRNSLCPLSMSEILKELFGAYFQQPSKQLFLSHDELDNEENRVLILIRTWFAQYCLSRLQLRKGEKAESGNYESEQAVEQSSIWRQGYLKALTELGVDLQGKVHKAVHFTRKSDPDEDVRSIAQECYKAIRREQNKSQSAPDIRRGLIAAYWWLQLAQRQYLEAPINHEEALRTRRRMLRHP